MDYDKFINKYYEDIFKMTMNIIHNKQQAEDISQDICIRMKDKLNNYAEKGGTYIYGWIKRCVYNNIIDVKRKQNKLLLELTDNNHFKSLNLIDRNTDYSENQYQILFKLIEELSEPQQNVIKQRFKGKSFKDIANEQNESINTIVGRYRYAVLHLQKHKHKLYE